jgi:hypothetical protein
MEDVNRSLDTNGTSMESDQQSSILSRSHIGDDIVEIGGMIMTNHILVDRKLKG